MAADAEGVASAAAAIRDLLSSAELEGNTGELTAVLANLLNPVLLCSKSELRQTALSLIHDVCRCQSVWLRVSKSSLLPFVRELLQAVADKALRANESEVWADLNLSVVHAIANSHRPTAYAALLELSRDPLLGGLAVRCLEKINRSLPQYLSVEESGNLKGLLRAFQSHIHALYRENGEAAVLTDECVMTCLKGICAASGLVEVGEFVGLHVNSSEERLLWKRLLKTYSAAEKRRKSTTE
jgi:hypothetical protein